MSLSDSDIKSLVEFFKILIDIESSLEETTQSDLPD